MQQPIQKFSRNLEYKQLLSLLAWSVRWVNWYALQCRNKSKNVHITRFTLEKHRTDLGKTFILYRMQMLHLLSFPKPSFAQLVIELPCLMGFRASEVASWLAEYIDYQNMNTLIYDSKKKALFTIPLNLQVAEHSEQVLQGRTEGYVLRSRSNRNLNQQITPGAIWCIWKKWTKEAQLPNAETISPLTGRQFFAAEWYYSQNLSLVTLQMIMRHSHFETTLDYVRRLVFYEDLKRDYDRFQFKVTKDLEKKVFA